MLWLKALGCGLICAALGAALSGYIANECVTWYRISGREGGSGYFVVFIGLAGLMLGGIIGLVTALVMGGEFGRHLLTSVGIVLVLATVGWGAARAGGRVPPTLGGEEVILLVEIRCPAGWRANNRVKAGKNELRLASLNGSNVQTAVEVGRLDWSKARVESERTIVPGDLPVYDSSARRAVMFSLGGEDQGFLLEMPAKPEPRHQQWSGWLPEVADTDAVAKGFRYRFRVQRLSEVRQALETRRSVELERERNVFATLGPGSPLTDYLELFVVDQTQGYDEHLHEQVGGIIRSRSEELAPLLASPEHTQLALRSVRALNTVPASFAGPLRKVLGLMLGEVNNYRAADDPKDPDEVTAERIRLQFEDWVSAWRRLSEGSPREFPPELRALGEAAGGMDSRSPISRIAVRAGELLANK